MLKLLKSVSLKMKTLISEMSNPMAKSIHGGYYLKARKFDSSVIAHCTPCTREVWDWLLRNANHKPMNIGGKTINRGQVFTDYNEIIEGLHWWEGFIKKTYKKTDMDTTMRLLRKTTMITTRRTTRGVIITICNYDRYQNPKNYDKANGHDTGTDTETDMVAATINKNVKKEENSTGHPWLFSNKGFFDRQLKNNEGKPELDKYLKLVEFLHEKDDDGDYKFKNVLSLPKQISFKDYLTLKATEREYKLRSLKEVLESMENRKDLAKDYSNVFLTANGWLKMEFKK